MRNDHNHERLRDDDRAGSAAAAAAATDDLDDLDDVDDDDIAVIDRVVLDAANDLVEYVRTAPVDVRAGCPVFDVHVLVAHADVLVCAYDDRRAYYAAIRAERRAAATGHPLT